METREVEMGTKPRIEEVEQNVHKISFDEAKTLYLIGTAHVSQNSVELVEQTIESVGPDTIAVELDPKRHKAMTEKASYDNLDIIQIIKKRQLFFFIGQFILSSFQKKMAEKTGSAPGMEFKRAIEIATEKEARLVLADRAIDTTLKRAWGLTPFFSKVKLLFSLLLADEDPIEAKDIENLKESNAIDEMIDMFASQLPETKQVLIDERDSFLSYEIMNNLGETTVAVVGAGHVPGILKKLEAPVSPEERKEIDIVPPPTILSKIAPWIIPAIIVAAFGWGFYRGNHEHMMEFAAAWIIANGTLSALGCLIALAHPLTIVAGFIAAPLTSLNPTIGAGFVTALVQTFLGKPRVKDFEQIQKGELKIKGWWQNRLTKIFLTFILSSIGSSIGTFVAAPYLIKLLHG